MLWMRSHFNMEIINSRFWLTWLKSNTKLDLKSHRGSSTTKAWLKISKWLRLHCRFIKSTTYRSIWLIQGLNIYHILVWEISFQDWVSSGYTCYVKVLLTDHTSCRHTRETKVSLLTKYIIFVIWWWGLSYDDMRFIMWW